MNVKISKKSMTKLSNLYLLGNLLTFSGNAVIMKNAQWHSAFFSRISALFVVCLSKGTFPQGRC
jgi:hypothetical protein